MRFFWIFLTALAVIAFSGCGKKETPQTFAPPGPGMARPIQPQVLDYNKIEEVKPSGETATTVHRDLQLVLTKVFGGAKLFTFFEMGGQMGPQVGRGSHFTYAVKRQTTLEDVAALQKKMEARGYKLVLEGSKNPIKTLCFEKKIGDKIYSVTIGTTPGDQRVSVVVFPKV